MIRSRLSRATMAILTLMLMILTAGPPAPMGHGAGYATYTLTEWSIPTPNSVPRGLTLDPSGDCCWFVELSGNKVAHLNASANILREWSVPTLGSDPTSLAATTISGSPALFGTEYATNKVFLFLPGAGMFKEFKLATSDSGPEYISIEPGAAKITAWFTESGGPSNGYSRNSIGGIVYDSDTGKALLYEYGLPIGAGGGASGIHAGLGIIWIAGFAGLIGWNPGTAQFVTWPFPFHPSTSADDRSLDLDGFGQPWYTSRSAGISSTDNYVGVLRYDDTFREWQIPTPGADPRVVSISPSQNPWIAEQGGSKIAQLDPSSDGVVSSAAPTVTSHAPAKPKDLVTSSRSLLPSVSALIPSNTSIAGSTTGQFTEWALASGSGPHDVVVDSSGDIWLLESSANKIARLVPKPDFSFACDPQSLIIEQGNSTRSTCTVTSANGFSSAVELSASWLGTAPDTVNEIIPGPITPAAGGTASSTLIVSAGPNASVGNFTLRITATSGSITHDFDLPVEVTAGVADFTISVSPSTLSLLPGGSATSTVTVKSIGIFSSAVELTASGAPEGMTLAFGFNPVLPPAGGEASSILTVVASGAPTGTHTITIGGNSSSLARGTSLAVEITSPGPCLIATATHGSELSDAVQFLRNFRDKSILRTNTGSNFMIAFNALYYSFSPHVAQYIREHSAARAIAKSALYPFLGILRVGAGAFYLFPTNLELGAVASGFVVSSLIGMVYFATPLAMLLAYSPKARRIARALQLPAVGMFIATLAALAFVTTFAGSAPVLMLATCMFVLISLGTSALFTSHAILRIARRFREDRRELERITRSGTSIKSAKP